MKRPEGYDGSRKPPSDRDPVPSAPGDSPEPRPRRSRRAPRLAPVTEISDRDATPADLTETADLSASILPPTAGSSSRPAKDPRPAKPSTPATPAKPARRAKPPKESPLAPTTASDDTAERPAAAVPPRGPRPPSAAEVERRTRRGEVREHRRLERESRRAQQSELRRFSGALRRQRRWTIGIIAVALGVPLLVVGLALSPAFSLTTIDVEGTNRVSADEIAEALGDQLGRPLAFIDRGQVDAALAQFPELLSYSVLTLPPTTLRVVVVERAPIGTIRRDSGDWLLVDPAGVPLETAEERPSGVPEFVGVVPTGDDEGFAAAVDALLAMTPELRAQVDTVSASTTDTVTLTLVGVNQSVLWGDSSDPAQKAALLQALLGQHAGVPGTFDVSSPSNGIFRPA